MYTYASSISVSFMELGNAIGEVHIRVQTLSGKQYVELQNCA